MFQGMAQSPIRHFTLLSIVCVVAACGGDEDAGTDADGSTGAAGAAATMERCTRFAPGDHSLALDHDGQQRTYIVHVPPGYAGERVPLVIDIHGLTSNAEQQAAISGYRDKADAESFIVVHPNGLNASWNGGSLCCGSSLQQGVDDEGFLRAIVRRMQQEGCIDPARVYASGLSNGGAMSHLLACRAADVFAAAAPASMGNGTEPCAPSRPISVIMFRATNDALVAYDGGVFPSAQADFDQWTSLNGCTGEPETTHSICQTHFQCSAGVEVTLCTIEGGHVLYAAAAQQGAAVPDVAWEAFERYTLP
jgi:polyhydroxybutyrate depolymerase